MVPVAGLCNFGRYSANGEAAIRTCPRNPTRRISPTAEAELDGFGLHKEQLPPALSCPTDLTQLNQTPRQGWFSARLSVGQRVCFHIRSLFSSMVIFMLIIVDNFP